MESVYIMKNGSTIVISVESYNRLTRSDHLMGEVTSMITKGRSPEDVVAYIKLQTAAWVVDRL